MHALNPRVGLALLATLGLMVLLAVPAGAAPMRVSTPATPASDTSSCPNRVTPPPPVSLSEIPRPGVPAPKPVPVPDEPVGGPRMGECALVLPEGAPPLPEGITASAWLVADAASGEVLAAKDPHGRHRPASTIKLLTALLAVDQLNLDRLVLGTQEDADQIGSKAGVGPGGAYTVEDLLTGLLLSSGNDTAHALARQMGGMTATVAQMNELAADLGMLDTRAATPSGLDGPGSSISAYDLALLFGHVLADPVLSELLTTKHARFPGFGDQPPFTLSNDNKLLSNYRGALGGKTGFTDDSRHTYVGAAVQQRRPLVVVLLRGEQRPVPMWEQAAGLLDYGFDLSPGRPVGHLVTEPRSVEGGTGSATGPGTGPGAAPEATPEIDSGVGREAGPGAGPQTEFDPAASSSGAPLLADPPRSDEASATADQDEWTSSGGLPVGMLWLAGAGVALAVLGAVVRRRRA